MITCSGGMGGVITNSESLYQHRCRQFTLRIIGGELHYYILTYIRVYTYTHISTILVCEDRYPVLAKETAFLRLYFIFSLKVLLAVVPIISK